MAIRQVCVYAASSDKCHASYLGAAERLGRHLAQNGLGIVYGGGACGLMGRLAQGALSEGGKVIGVIPRFMEEVEWGHTGLTELRVVDDIHQRKRTMLEASDAVVALPGGCGTLEELFEAIAWKRLGLYTNPIAIVNTNGFYNPCVELLERCISERFMNPGHSAIWTLVDAPEEVVPALRSASPWSKNAIRSAAVQ
jgi:uncharacterized protein (TIGR00730 family)